MERDLLHGHFHPVQAEIAEREGILLGSVKGRTRLGLQKLRLLLQEYGVDQE